MPESDHSFAEDHREGGSWLAFLALRPNNETTVQSVNTLFKRRPRARSALELLRLLNNIMLPAIVYHVLAAHVPRRLVLTGSGAVLATMAPMNRAAHAATAKPPPGFEGIGGFESGRRIEGIGSGFDILSASPSGDVLYPPFLNGTWLCQRVITSVEGDVGQARGAWRLLGGDGDFDARQPETYEVQYLDTRRAGSITGLDGKTYYGMVLDRGSEIDARTHGAKVAWDDRSPGTLSYERTAGGLGSAAELRVVQRSVETPGPSSQGWGSNELIRVTTSSSTPLLGEIKIDYAVRRLQRFKRADVTEDGRRRVEGLEIVKTYRVLDGVAGIEYPTSTTKSVLKLTRSRA